MLVLIGIGTYNSITAILPLIA